MDLLNNQSDDTPNSSTTITGTSEDDSLIGGNEGGVILGEAGDDYLLAGNGNSTLNGGAGNDILSGGIGEDVLDGGDGNDLLANSISSNSQPLTGGSGADIFFFFIPQYGENAIVEGEVINEPLDVVTDFNASEGDRIRIDGRPFNVAPGDTSSLEFNSSTGALSLEGQLVAEISSSEDSDILNNTDIVDNELLVYEATIVDDTVAVGGEGGDATNGGTGSEGNDAVAEDGEVVIGDDVAVGDDVVVGEDGSDGNVDVYRFFEPNRGFHFYTSSEQEKDTIQQQSENGELSYTYEGESFSALAEDDDGDPLTGAKPVYRFFNQLTGAHLYTISEKEKNNIVDSLPDYNLEGVAYYAYDTPQENTIPLYRLYNNDTGTHFFTPSAVERDNALDNLPGYSAEGEDAIAFHVLPIDL